MPFTLPELPYSYDALEPYIDAKTMEIHHTKHHATYIEKLNIAVKDLPAELAGKSVEELVVDLNAIPENIRTTVRNHGGGHANHSFFWQTLAPHSSPEPIGKLAEAINKKWNSVSAFQEEFNKAATGQFGSGWAWVCVGKDGELLVTSTPNQDTPLSSGLKPVLGLDVWEHAYYLKYQQKRADYIAAWWNVVNWEQVDKNYQAAII